MVFPNSSTPSNIVKQFNGLSASDMKNVWFANLGKENTLSLYINIPYCANNCYYCMYYHRIPSSDEVLRNCLDGLDTKLNFYESTFSKIILDTLYIGGGSPNILGYARLKRLFELIFNSYKFSVTGEKTLEIKLIKDLDLKILDLAKRSGFNRISFGIQSFNKHVLSLVNRSFIPPEVVKFVFSRIQKLGFEDFNVDLMSELPGDTLESLFSSLEILLQMGLPEITIYRYRHLPQMHPAIKKLYEKGTYSKYKQDDYLKLIHPLLNKYGYTHYCDSAEDYCQKFYRNDVWKHKQRTVKNYYLTKHYPLQNNHIIGMGEASRTSMGKDCFIELKNNYYPLKDDVDHAPLYSKVLK